MCFGAVSDNLMTFIYNKTFFYLTESYMTTTAPSATDAWTTHTISTSSVVTATSNVSEGYFTAAPIIVRFQEGDLPTTTTSDASGTAAISATAKNSTSDINLILAVRERWNSYRCESWCRSRNFARVSRACSSWLPTLPKVPTESCRDGRLRARLEYTRTERSDQGSKRAQR